MTKELLTQ